MADGLLIKRILLLFLVSDLDYSSAFPSARSYQHPEARKEAVRKQQEEYGFGNRHPLYYIRGLSPLHGNLQPRLNDHAQMRTWQKPQSSPKVRSHVPLQNPPSPYHQVQRPYQPRSEVRTEGTARSYHPLLRPRGFEFNLKVPFADILGQKRETISTAKGSESNTGGSGSPADHSQLFRPSSVQIHSKFDSASSLDSEEQTTPELSEPSFQLSLSVPVASRTPSPIPSTSNDGHGETLQRWGSVGFVQNPYMEQAEPQSSSTQSGSESTFSNSGDVMQQQTEHQSYEPNQTIHTNSTHVTFSRGHVSQHLFHTEEVSQGKIPDQQSLDIPERSATLEYPLDKVQAFCYEYWESQGGQIASRDPTNVYLSSPSFYESIPSGHYSAGQVSGTNYDQLVFVGQNAPHLNPKYPQGATVAPSQYELPSSHQYDVTNYGTGNVAQVWPTDASYYNQHGRDESAQDVLPDHLTEFDSSPNVPGLPKDPGQHTRRGQLKHMNSQLFGGVVDE